VGKETLKCELWAKCEFFNAGGSVKDRIGKRMVEEGEKDGRWKPGYTLIEPTSGNTGIGISLAGAVKDYNVIITLPKKMSNEKIAVLKALGSKVIRTPTEAAFDDPDSHIGVAKKLQQELPNAFIPDQYSNMNNTLAHYEGTAEELIRQTNGKIDMVVISAGTGGTITGIARKLKEKIPGVKVIGVDPQGSILAGPGPIFSYQVEGIGYDFLPDVFDGSIVDGWYRSRDTESFVNARRLIREEGLLCGGSSGCVVAAALEFAKDLRPDQRCVLLLADSIRNYLSKFADDNWMYDYGHFEAPSHPALKDLTVANLTLKTYPSINSNASCTEAKQALKASNLKYLPVIKEEDGSLFGLVTLQSLTTYLLEEGTGDDPIKNARLPNYRVVPSDFPLNRLKYSLIVNGGVVVVGDKPEGGVLTYSGHVITDEDFFNFVTD